MTCRIDLNKQILEQLQRQDIRELLNLPLEQLQGKNSLEELLKAAQAAICGELVDTGYDEKELLGLRLECTLAPKESHKSENIYSIEWPQPSQEIDSNKVKLANTAIPIANNSEEELDDSKQVSSPQLPVSIEFLKKLTKRFDEAIADVVPESTGSNLFWSFRSFPIKKGGSCRCKNEHDGLLYHGKKLATGECSGSGPCGGFITDRPPIE
ncbi:hypothetical protein I8752_05455 [Nostocaceae cyanobacterium CENA369]|uniref:Uncharacterized protein n=1 Tax=Dendronalium phyllosphericum CENA369 TaxID=1725256 RepID=A0A8J7HY90_9NOST|nr:hypothetical protein [Dendronalium phyllosphericum]MBH8572491.1 hypothetical protein [Dendronalium phyllosphericum CENA369]